MVLKSFIIKTLRDWCMRHNQHFMVFHGALHRLYTVDRGDVTPIYPTPYQRLIGPSQGGAVKSMGNFEAQTPLLDTNTQKKISISKKKSTGQIIIPMAFTLKFNILINFNSSTK